MYDGLQVSAVTSILNEIILVRNMNMYVRKMSRLDIVNEQGLS